MIRRATVYDVPAMQQVISSHAELGKMLFKSYAQLYETLRDFAVFEEAGTVVGCTALAIIWADLSEVRSLAVDEKHRGKGIGSKLVRSYSGQRILTMGLGMGFALGLFGLWDVTLGPEGTKASMG